MNPERWGWYSVGLSLAIAALHAAIAATSGSLAVAAELVHNLIDLAAAVAVLAGLKLAARKTPAFPYGLYKLENLVALALAGLVFASAYEIARGALIAPATVVRTEGWMLAVLAVTAFLPFAFAHFELRAARAANSPALIADAKEYRVHVLTTGLALVALASQWTDVALDRAAALVIVAAIAWTGWGLLRDAMRVLLDASLDAPALAQIRALVMADPAVAEVKWVTGRNAGRYRFVEVGVALRPVGLEKIEATLRRIEEKVRAAIPHVDRTLVHVEAPASPSVRHAVALADVAGSLSPHFGEAPFFALTTIRHADGGIDEQRILANPHRMLARGKGIRVAEWLVGHKVDVVVLREDVRGKGPDYVFRDAGVALRHTDRTTLSEALSESPGGSDPLAAPSDTETVASGEPGGRS